VQKCHAPAQSLGSTSSLLLVGMIVEMAMIMPQQEPSPDLEALFGDKIQEGLLASL
jgi:hypothetical protein